MNDVVFAPVLIIDDKGTKIVPFQDDEMTPKAAALTVEELVQIFQRNAKDLDSDLFEQSMGRPFDDSQIVIRDSRYHGMVWVKVRCSELGADLASEIAKTLVPANNAAEAYVRRVFSPLETWWAKHLLEPHKGEGDETTGESEGTPE